MFSLLFSSNSHAQINVKTYMTEVKELSTKKLKVWNLTSEKGKLGRVYTLEPTSNIGIKFLPTEADTQNTAMVVTGTYTSYPKVIAGNAFKNCQNIGNPNDKLFKPNSYLVFDGGKISFNKEHGCNSISVYKLIDSSTILFDVIDARTYAQTEWRFLVQKSWEKIDTNGSKTYGDDWLIVDFTEKLTIAEACFYIKGLERTNMYYINSGTVLTSKIMGACLLDTGINRPFLLKGISLDGTFNLSGQTNIIVVE